uniref:Ig-like domain-containing protein n=1 Tax=Anguilla anguilla TaxID=7936 RepID=A0A0E9R8T4_ANGAN
MRAVCLILFNLTEIYGQLWKSVDQPNVLVTAQLGDTVTLPCFYSAQEVPNINWFKLASSTEASACSNNNKL